MNMRGIYRAPLSLVAVAASVALLTNGCATPNAVTYTPATPPPHPFRRRAPADVEVFLTGPAPRPHVDVGSFETYQGRRNDGNPRPTNDVLYALRVHAALRGCDALQIIGLASSSRYHSGALRGVCQMYVDAPAAQAPPNAVAVPPPFPGEGDACAVPGRPVGHARLSCPDPLVCVEGACASPYR